MAEPNKLKLPSEDELYQLFVDLSEFLDGQVDIVDGDWPDPPKPNRAAVLKFEVDKILGTAWEGY